MTTVEPKVMPYQELPFNGDSYIQEEFIKLRDKFQIVNAVETGTCLGSTTLFLAANFQQVYTVELNETYLNIAKEKFILAKNIKSWLGDSVAILNNFLNHIGDKTIYFLDAHWRGNCPLKDELKAIAKAGIKPVIAIHDFFVPGKDFGFDYFNGQPYDIDWVKPELDAIYGKDYEYYYNSEATGAKRGIIYITPK